MATTLTARLEKNGRILLPAAVRKQLGVKPGDQLLLHVSDDGVHLTTLPMAVRRVQEELRRYVPRGASLADEVIAMRRAEVEREGTGAETDE